jgi:FkbM family methyltransferase
MNIDSRFAIHHIGGRGGNSEIKAMPRFEGDFVRVFYDADESCINQIRRNTSRRWLTRFGAADAPVADYRILPYCVAERTGPVQFNLAYDPNCSSLLPMQPYFPDLTVFNDAPKSQDYRFRDAAQPIRTLNLDAYSLDDLLLGKHPEVPLPDILSVDVEGGESQVLAGAESVLRSVVCFVGESQFTPMFEGQALYGDLNRFLADRGFVFVRFLNTSEWAPCQSPVGLRSRGFATTGDVVYLRDPRHLAASALTPGAKRLQLTKLAFCALMWDQMEFALMALAEADKFPADRTIGDRVYGSFLAEVAAAAAAMPKVYVPLFSQKFSAEQSHARYQMREPDPVRLETTFSGRRRLRNRLRVMRKKSLRRLMGRVRSALPSPSSPVEQVLRRYGFSDLAACLKDNRVRMQGAIEQRS